MHKLIFRKIFILSHLAFAVADSDVFGIIVFFKFHNHDKVYRNFIQ